MGADAAEGKYLLFLNDDIVVDDAEWLEKLTATARLTNAGAVGAKLLYPEENRIQHCGVISIANGPVHAFIGERDDSDCYFGRNCFTYNYLAVTAACMCIRREIFPRFNEKLSVAYNDVELCFRLYKAGYYNAVVNDIKLYHYESYSRGNDLADKAKLQRLINERHKLYALHPEFRGYDPFYNPALSQLRADFRKRRVYDFIIEFKRKREL
jgi:GT2 family glycosyltransferase